jgi:hypothetical protein
MAVALVPIGYLLYQFTGPGNYEHKYLTRVINSYDHYRTEAAQINALHTDALELAAADRNLFINSKRAENVTLKFPEYVMAANIQSLEEIQDGIEFRNRTAHCVCSKRIQRGNKRDNDG